MAKAFLSHSSSDKELVRRIAQQIGQQKCVLDEWSFDAGELTLDEIYKKLDSSDLLVFFISDKALDSPWVKKEVLRARKNIDKEMLDKILPIIIDQNIDYTDSRIPKWMAKSYNIKKITNERVLLNRIQRAMRSVNVIYIGENNIANNVFVGRAKELQAFEQDINNIDDWVPTCIVANGYYEGIGRRTFLRVSLERNNLVDKLIYRPLTISLDSRESIESFIYQLNYINPDSELAKKDLTKMSIDDKIDLAFSIVKEYVAANEIIFIIDDGGVVKPGGWFVDWFVNLIEKLRVYKKTVFCLVSSFRPNKNRNKSEENWYLAYDIPELNPTETKTLFLKLLKNHGVVIQSVEDKEYFIKNLKGIPQQILYAVSLIKADLFNAKNSISEIVEFSDRYSSTMLGIIKNDRIAYQIAVFLAGHDIVNLDLLYSVFGDDEEVHAALSKLYEISAFTFVFDDNSHIKLNGTLSDYINRIKETLDEKYKNAFVKARKQLLSQDLDYLVSYDYSSFLVSIQEMMKEGVRIPPKYYMPSLLMKYIAKMYDGGQYYKVIDACEQLLLNTNYDNQILQETKFLLLQSYARLRKDDFYKYINDFKDDPVSYHFLRGFYFRFQKINKSALEEFHKVLEILPSHSLTKREIVNVYLSERMYKEALPAAKDNYYQRRNNIYHLQSYFIALTHRPKSDIDTSDYYEIEKLMSEAENLSESYQKAKDIYNCMKGQYEYFITNDLNMAEATLKEALNANENKYYPYRALQEIYRSEKAFDKLAELNNNYSKYSAMIE